MQHNEINIKVWKYKINPSLYKYFDQSKKKLIWLILTARKIIICISSRLRKSVILFAEIHSRPFLHPRWIPSTTVIRILSRDSFLLVRPRFFPPPPLDVHGRCLEKRGTFPRLKSTLLVKSPNSSHLRPFSIATSATTPQTRTKIVPSFHVYRFLCGSMCERFIVILFLSSYTFISSFTSDNLSYVVRSRARISYDKCILLLYAYIFIYIYRYILLQERRNSLY